MDKLRSYVQGVASALLTLLMLSPVAGSSSEIAPQASLSSAYYSWQTQSVGDSADLVTLFCRRCGSVRGYADELPLVSVLRDTLGDDARENDRITYVWLLSSTHQNLGQQLLAAVPFFYWRVGDGSTHIDQNKPVKPLLDLTRPERPMSVQILRDVLQWTVLDPLSMPVRATSRAYRTNEVARERADLEEAMTYLREAPKDDSGQGLTQAEADVVIARLALRKNLLGGLVEDRNLRRVGEREIAGQESIRSRNWDLLRGFAEKTGLYFEALDVAGTSAEYAVLWFPIDPGAGEPVGSSHDAVWKALNLKNPWTDSRLRDWEGPVFERWLDANGSLLALDSTGVRKIRLVPLGAYSLNYPKFPLLMIDFRDKLHLRRDEMTQRAINEVTAGVIGISHFANWYYYVGATTYDFVASRHGRGMDAALRLDSYSQFRSALALDNEMDPKLRSLLERRIASVSLNPLEGSAEHKLQATEARYQALVNAASSGVLESRLNGARSAEIRDFGKSQTVLAGQSFVRLASFDLFDSPTPSGDELKIELDRNRRIEGNLALLRKAADEGPNVEIAYDPAILRAAVEELSALLPAVRSQNVRTQAENTIQRLGNSTRNGELQADCSSALARLQHPLISDHPGIETAPKTVINSIHHPDLIK